MIRITRRGLLVGASALAMASVGGRSLRAADNIEILASLPNMAFPFFVHMMKAIHGEAEKLGEITIVESDGQGSSPKQTADVETALVRGVKGISPNEVDAMAPAIKGAIEAGVPVVTIDRRVDKVEGILAHVGADNVKGGEAQGELVMKLFPDGAKVMNLQGQPGASPAIDRNKGLHNVLDKAADKYNFVFEQTANFARDKGLTVTEAGLAGMAEPPDVIVAANDDMALGAMEAVKARNLSDKIAILGFDALPEALAAVRDGALTATIEQFPGGQSTQAVDILIDKIRNGKDPASNLILLTPVAITKDNLDQAERLGEVT
jgi:inositol transport system substrate-binding protein